MYNLHNYVEYRNRIMEIEFRSLANDGNTTQIVYIRIVTRFIKEHFEIERCCLLKSVYLKLYGIQGKDHAIIRHRIRHQEQ